MQSRPLQPNNTISSQVSRPRQTHQKHHQSKTSSTMSKNVTQFRHLLANSSINDWDIDWTINLRVYKNAPRANQVQNTPEVYHKSTESWNNRISLKEHNIGPFNSSNYHQFLKQKNNRTKSYNAHHLNFITSLRSPKSEPQRQRFNCLPSKSMGQPLFLKKENIHKVRDISKDDLESGLDGTHKYPGYTEKILKNRNYGHLASFTKAHGRTMVNLPSLAWQVGLRDY